MSAKNCFPRGGHKPVKENGEKKKIKFAPFMKEEIMTYKNLHKKKQPKFDIDIRRDDSDSNDSDSDDDLTFNNNVSDSSDDDSSDGESHKYFAHNRSDSDDDDDSDDSDSDDDVKPGKKKQYGFNKQKEKDGDDEAEDIKKWARKIKLQKKKEAEINNKRRQVLEFVATTPTILDMKLLDEDTDFHVLGVVKSIEKYVVKISLPNDHEAELPINNICDSYNDKLQEMIDNNQYDEEEISELSEAFHMYAPVRCCVSEIVQGQTGHVINVTVDPKIVNRGLQKSTLLDGMILSCTVSSVEDHGYILDIGVADVTAFVTNAKAYKYIQLCNNENKLKIGHYLTVKLEIVDNKYRILNVSIVLPGMNFDDNILEDPSLDVLIPGMRLPCSVTSMTPSGVIVSALSYTGSIGLSHMDFTQSYDVGDKFTAVLLFIKKSTRELILSTLPYLLTADTNRTDPFHAHPIGSHLSEAVLKAVGEAAYFDSNGIRACAKDLKSIDNQDDREQLRQCEVIGHDYMDNLLLVKYNRKINPADEFAEFKFGELITVKVTGVSSDEIQVVANGHKAFIPAIQTDISAENLSTKYTKQKSIKCRVLHYDSNGMSLTHKNAMVHSNDKLFTSYSVIVHKDWSYGVISSHMTWGVKVLFYGGVQGVLHRHELSHKLMSTEEMLEVYPIGEVVRCRVILNCVEAGFIKLSLKEYTGNPLCNLPENMQIGKIYDVEVTKKTPDWLIVKCCKSSLQGRISKYHMSDCEETSTMLFLVTPPGTILKNCLCLGMEKDYIFTMKPLFVKYVKSHNLLSDNMRTVHNEIIPAFIDGVSDDSITVSYTHDLKTLIKKEDISDSLSGSLTKYFHCAQTVLTCVNCHNGRIRASMKETEIYPHKFGDRSVDLLLPYLKDFKFAKETYCQINNKKDKYFSLCSLKPGTVVTAQVTSFDDDSIYLTYKGHEGKAAMVQMDAEYTIGDDIQAVILHTLVLCKQIIFSVDTGVIASVKNDDKLDLYSRESANVLWMHQSCLIVYLLKSQRIAYLPSRKHINDVCTLNDIHCGQTVIVRIRKQSKFGLIVSYVDHVTSPNIVHVYGDYVTASITYIKEHSVVLKIGKYRGQIHMSQLAELAVDNVGLPLSEYKVGQDIQVHMKGFWTKKTEYYDYVTNEHVPKRVVIECSTKSNDDGLVLLSNIAEGHWLKVFVTSITDSEINVEIGSDIKGIVRLTDLSTDAKIIENASSIYQIGQHLHAQVLTVRHDNVVELTMIRSLNKLDSVQGSIQSVQGGSVTVKLPRNSTGVYTVNRLYQNDSKYTFGQMVECVIGECTGGDKYQCCIVEERFINPAHTVAVSKNDIVEDDIYTGHVESLGDDNIVIRLCMDVCGSLSYSDVCRHTLQDYSTILPVGQSVVVKVKSISDEGVVTLTMLEGQTGVPLGISLKNLSKNKKKQKRKQEIPTTQEEPAKKRGKKANKLFITNIK